MESLKKAIYTKFTAEVGGVHNAFYTVLAGRFYFERAPQNAVLPYAVYHLISDVPDYNFTSTFETVRIQIDLFSSSQSSTEVDSFYEKLKLLFDWCSLTVAGNVHLYMKRVLARQSQDPEDDNWTYNVDYEIMLEKS